MSTEVLAPTGSASNVPRTGRDPSRSAFVLPAGGPPYYMSWIAVGLFTFFTILSLYSGLNPILALGGFGGFVLLGLTGVLYFRTGRTFEADLLGVRVTHGARVVRDISWTEVKRVQYGIRPVVHGEGWVRNGPFLTVSRHGAHRGIDLDLSDYPGRGDLDAPLAAFAADVARLAGLRGVPTEWQDYREPAWRRKRPGGPG